MKKFFASITTVIFALALPVMAAAATWTIDPDHSNIGFKIKHLMVSNVKGSFDKHTGIVELDEKDITKSKVEVSIETASINTNVQLRDAHLKSADFFDVTKYPAMSFVSKKITRAGKEKLKVTGDLTLHGITKEVILNVDGPSKEVKDPSGKIRKGATATTTINRKDFGLNWNKTLETGGVLVGEEVNIVLEIEMIKAKDK